MTLPLPTDTAHVRIESRQYRIFNFDLGEGIRRSSMKVAALIFTPWLVLMGLMGVSVLGMAYLWLGPPSIATWLAVTRDDSGRVRLRSWLDAAAYRLNRSGRLVLNADTARPDSGVERVTVEFAVLHPPQPTGGGITSRRPRRPRRPRRATRQSVSLPSEQAAAHVATGQGAPA